MNNKELQKKVWANLENSQDKAAKFEDTVAVTFALISDANEDFYVAVTDGKLSVEPYHYDQFGCEIEASADTVNKLFSGALSFDKALKDGLAVVRYGDVAKFKALECLVPEKKAAKAASKTEKKPAAKKAAPKAAEKPAAKAAEKPAAKAAEKPAAKAEEKKAAPAAKPAAKTAAPAAKPAAKTAAKPAGKTAKK